MLCANFLKGKCKLGCCDLGKDICYLLCKYKKVCVPCHIVKMNDLIIELRRVLNAI